MSQQEETPADESVKDRIRRISADLFAEKGYHGTGIQEIGDAVGLGRGALYYHIRSKEALLQDISIRSLREMLEEAQGIAALDLPASERIELLAETYVAGIARKRSRWNVALFQSSALSDKLREEVVMTRQAYEATWERLLLEGTEAGEWGAVHPLVLKGLLGMLSGTYLWIHPGGDIDPGAIGRKYAQLVIHGLRERPDVHVDWSTFPPA